MLALIPIYIRTWLGFDQVPHGHLLHSTRQMPIGQSLDLSPPNTDEKDAALTWVVTERRADALLISPLIRQERLEKDQRRAQRWRAGQPLEATFWHDVGIEYAFTTTVLSVPASHQLALAHSNDVLHTQQRHFLRIDADFPLTLYALPTNDAQSLIQSLVQTLAAHTDSQAMPPSEGVGNGAQNDFPINLENLASIQCQAVDLSAGGLGLISDAALPEAQHFLLDPKFSGDYPLAGLLCQQVRRYRSSQSYHLQTKFIDLPLATENELVRLINQHQITAHQPTPASPSSSGNTS